MIDQLEKRLQELKAEFEMGQKRLADIKTQAKNLRNTLMRISGAIQVLQEELGRYNTDSSRTPQQTDPQMEETAKPEAGEE